MSLLDDAIREHLELMRRRGADAADVARAEREALGIRSPEEEAREAAAAAGIIPATPASDPAAEETQIARPAPAPSSAPYEEAPDFGRDAEAVSPVEAPPAIEPSIDVPVGEILHDARDEPEPVAAAPEPVAAPDPEPIAEAPAPAPPAEDPEVVERASQSTVAFSPDEVAAATAAEEAAHAAPAPDPEPVAAPEAPEAPAPAHEDADFVYERDPEPREEAPEASAPAAPAEPAFDPEPTREHAAPVPREPAPEPAAADPAPAADGEPEDVLEETPDFLQETPEHDRLWFEQRPPRDFDF